VSTSGADERRGIVHRLDVGTSGLMVVAKSERAYTVLKDAFRERTVDKRYHALVQGHPDPLTGTVDAPIDRHPTSAYKYAVVSGGRDSVTHYETIEAFRHATLLDIRLETGRTHQIRVHMSALRHPCVGDITYGADPTLGRAARARPAVAARRRAGLRAPGRRPAGPLHEHLPGRPAGRPGPGGCRLVKLDPRDLDRRLVPTAARALRGLLDAGARTRRRAAGRLRAGLVSASATAQRVDDRATATGPLRVLRDVPQLAALVVAAVFLAGSASALLLAEPDPPAPAAAPARPAAPSSGSASRPAPTSTSTSPDAWRRRGRR
jgi:hypothetical protein